MPRQLRPYAPGAFFHLGTRTQGAEKWFSDEMKTRIVGFIGDAAEGCDVDLCNFVVMDNHLHLIVRQRSAPLSAFVQPLLRRCALLVRREVGIKDHVFGKHYWHRMCADPHDLRTCSGYVHRNPTKAKICTEPAEYAWSSAPEYEDRIPPNWSGYRPRLFVLHELFATTADATPDQLRADYVACLKNSVTADGKFCPSLDAYHHGDAYWRGLQHQLSDVVAPISRVRPDLRDVVRAGIMTMCPDFDVEMVRTFRGAFMSAIRRELVIRAALAGHRGCDIARFLQMSETRVSKILKGLPGRPAPCFGRFR